MTAIVLYAVQWAVLGVVVGMLAAGLLLDRRHRRGETHDRHQH
ncbi:MAG: hypothetical protein ACR2KG_12155 [Nocardioidaceae bacterium]